jgi:membrane protein
MYIGKFNFIKKAFREAISFNKTLTENSIGAYSAQAAFFIITSFFPFMLLMVSLLRFTPLDVTVVQNTLENDVLGAFTGEFVSRLIREVMLKATPGALLGVAGVSAVWAASRCLMSIIEGLNKVYSTKSKMNFITLRLISVFYVFVLQLMVIVSLGILVFGEQINNYLVDEFNLQILSEQAENLRWAVGFLLLILFFMFIYTVVPDGKPNNNTNDNSDKKPRLKNAKVFLELPGAVLSAVGWLGFSWVFAVYMTDFANFGAVYGSLATAVSLMLWLYFCMYIMFAGAQFNVRLQEWRKLRTVPTITPGND